MNRGRDVQELLDEHSEDGHVFPAYGDYCFERVAPTALSTVGDVPSDTDTLPDDVFDGVDTEGIEHVVLVLVDGLGYDAWTRVQSDVPLLSAIADAGAVTPLTSVYPTETAAAIPTLHTGVAPIEHGLLGWNQFVASLSATVQALPWKTTTGDDIRSIYADPPDWRETFLAVKPLYDRVDRYTQVVQPADIVESASASALTRGVDRRFGFHNVADAAVTTRRALESTPDRSYTMVYLPNVDLLAHREGPASEGARAQVEAIASAIDRELCSRLDSARSDRTLLVLTADHGLTDTQGQNIDLRGYDPIWNNLASGPDGEPIPPVGSSRSLQLFLDEDAIDEVRETLERDFDARVFTRPEYEARDLFGQGDPASVYEARAPDLLCIHRDRGMWYEDDSLAHVGKHGGLTREEMLVPFAAARLGELSA